jgi:hypothetical protein
LLVLGLGMVVGLVARSVSDATGMQTVRHQAY